MKSKKVKGAVRRLAAVLFAIALLALGGAAVGRQAAEIPEITAAELPGEARETLELIQRGGPFPYERDGAVFGNRERRLPARSHGYYREYTVKTPSARDRGARRIVAGGCAQRTRKPDTSTGMDGKARRQDPAQRAVAPCNSGEYYYTDDHYGSFRRIRGER